MRCPDCDSPGNRVVDTRTSRGGRAVRRRRECSSCGTRFTTYEYVEERPVQVLKRGGSVEEFDRSKLIRAVRTACARRAVSLTEIEGIADEIEDTLARQAGVEVKSSLIGEMVMERLKPLDRVAYVRFASVYRNFQDPDEFQEFVDEMKERGRIEALRRDQSELPL
jgi:transcriptional repressor NrdR